MGEAELGLNGDSEIEDLQLSSRRGLMENCGGEEFVDGFSNLTLSARLTEIDIDSIVISAACRSFISHCHKHCHTHTYLCYSQ